MSKLSGHLSGHKLYSEGAPFDALGRPVNIYHGGTRGDGRGKCSCGALSDVLDSVNKRKQWHREHKDTIRIEAAK